MVMTRSALLQPSESVDASGNDVDVNVDIVDARRSHNAQSAVAGLPVEILSMFFEAAALSSRDHDLVNRTLLPSLMCCSLFRTTALATPLIWSFIHYQCGSKEEWMFRYRASNPHFITLQLERSRSVDLRVFVEIEGGGFDSMTRLENSVAWFKDALNQHIHRCRELRIIELSTPPSITMLPLQRDMPALRWLSYWGDKIPEPPLPLEQLHNSPRLRVLKFTYIRASPTLATQTSLSPRPFDDSVELFEAWLYPMRLTDLLPYTSSLSKLRFLRTSCLVPSQTAGGSGKTTLEFPALEALVLAAPAPDLDWVISVKAPKLSKLQLGERNSAFRLPSFCLKSHFPLLDTFQMSDRPAKDDSFIAFLSAHRTLRNISFSIGSTRNLVWFKRLCELLSKPNTEQSSLPHLERIHCYSWIRDTSPSLEFIQGFVTLMQVRKTLRVDWNDLSAVMELSGEGNREFKKAVKAVKSRWDWNTEEDYVADAFDAYEAEGS